jgi:ParB-like chromosome segregation protein Spo0J
MEIVDVKIEELKEAEYNPRKMSEKQVSDLTESITSFGLVDPIIVNSHSDRYNIVIGGHQRLKIARMLGFATVPVHYVGLELERERELNLRLNKTGEWDWDALANFDIELLADVGFAKKDLEFHFDLDSEKMEKRANKKIKVCPNCQHEFI